MAKSHLCFLEAQLLDDDPQLGDVAGSVGMQS